MASDGVQLFFVFLSIFVLLKINNAIIHYTYYIVILFSVSGKITLKQTVQITERLILVSICAPRNYSMAYLLVYVNKY